MGAINLTPLFEQATRPLNVLSPFQQQEQQNALASQRQALAESQQNQQLNDLKIQAVQRQMADQQALQRALQEAYAAPSQAATPAATAPSGSTTPAQATTQPAGFDPDAFMRRAVQLGVTPETAQTYAKAQLAVHEAANKLGADQAELHSKHADILAGQLQGLLGMDEEHAAEAYPGLMSYSVKNGIADANELKAAGLDPATYPGHDAISKAVPVLIGYKEATAQRLAQLKADSENAKNAAETNKLNLDAAQTQRAEDAAMLAAAAKQGPDKLQAALDELPHGRAKAFDGLTDPTQIMRVGMTPEQLTRADQTAASLANTQAHQKEEESQGKARIGIERQRLQMEQGMMGGASSGAPQHGGTSQLHGDAYLASLPPGLAAQVKAISEGRATLPAMSRNVLSGQIRNAVFQYDPDYSDQRAQVRRAFTTGTDGKNIGALNTATMHLDQLSDAADALKNGSFQPGNGAYNYFSSILGKPAPTNFAALKAAVAGEMASALKGNATDQEIHTMSQNISSAQSPDQLKGAVDTNLHILGAKLNTYQERYNQQFGGKDQVWSPVLPSAKAVYAKHGIDPTAKPGETTAQAGGIARPQSQAEFDKLKKGDHFINPKDGKEYVKN